MATLDYILLTPIVIALIRGLFRGFVKEVMGIIALVAAVVVARLFAPMLTVRCLTYIDWPEGLMRAIVYVLIFLSTAALVRWIARLFSSFLRGLSLGWLNHLLGGVFGCLSCAILVSLLLNLAVIADSYAHFIKPELTANSQTYQPILHIAGATWDMATGK